MKRTKMSIWAGWLWVACSACLAAAYGVESQSQRERKVATYLVAERDFMLTLVVDFSSGHPLIQGGHCYLEFESGPVERSTMAGFDFQARLGVFGIWQGRYVNPELSSPVHEIEVIFAGEPLVLSEMRIQSSPKHLSRCGPAGADYH